MCINRKRTMNNFEYGASVSTKEKKLIFVFIFRFFVFAVIKGVKINAPV